MDPFLKRERRRANAALLSWVLVLVPAALGLAVWMSFHRTTEIALAVSEISIWSWDAIKTFAFIGYGLVWLAAVFLMQHLLYRSAVRNGLWSRMAQLNALLLLLLAGSHAVRFLLGASDMSVRALLQILLEAGLAAALYAQYRRTSVRRAA